MRFNTTLFISFFFCFYTTFGQQKISGRIIGEDLEIPMEIKVFDQNTTEIGKTDFNGYFEIELQKDYENLIFAGLGYEWTKIKLPVNCENLEIILLNEVLYHYISNRKIDRLRKKRFDKITELHTQAYNKGLFKTEKPCFNQKFEPYKPELDEIGRQMKLTKKQIKTKFKELKIGDTVKVPTQTWSAYTDGTDFGCLISGKIIGKNKKKDNYNLIIKVTDNLCEKEKTIYNGNPVEVGDSITHNMKYYKIITE